MSGIVIEKVRKSFDTKDGVVEALKDVNLNIDSGDIYGIIGTDEICNCNRNVRSRKKYIGTMYEFSGGSYRGTGSDRWEGSWRFDREGIEKTEGRDWYDLPAFQSADAEVSDR